MCVCAMDNLWFTFSHSFWNSFIYSEDLKVDELTFKKLECTAATGKQLELIFNLDKELILFSCLLPNTLLLLVLQVIQFLKKS